MYMFLLFSFPCFFELNISLAICLPDVRIMVSLKCDVSRSFFFNLSLFSGTNLMLLLLVLTSVASDLLRFHILIVMENIDITIFAYCIVSRILCIDKCKVFSRSVPYEFINSRRFLTNVGKIKTLIDQVPPQNLMVTLQYCTNGI